MEQLEQNLILLNVVFLAILRMRASRISRGVPSAKSRTPDQNPQGVRSPPGPRDRIDSVHRTSLA